MITDEAGRQVIMNTSGNKRKHHLKKRTAGQGRPSKLRQAGGLRLDLERLRQGSKRLAPAYYIGRQKGIEGMKDFDLYNLTENIPGYVEGSTVSGRTLKAAAFQLPPRTPNPDYE